MAHKGSTKHFSAQNLADHFLWEKVKQTVRPLGAPRNTVMPSRKLLSATHKAPAPKAGADSAHQYPHTCPFTQKRQSLTQILSAPLQKNQKSLQTGPAAEKKTSTNTKVQDRKKSLSLWQWQNNVQSQQEQSQALMLQKPDFLGLHKNLSQNANIQDRAGCFDKSLYKKLSKGQIRLEASLDLHDLTREQAYSVLYAFVKRSYEKRLRHVLVVTGKGERTHQGGILRRSVPLWMETQSFSPFVSAIQIAARQHGGAGAFYVRLKRKT